MKETSRWIADTAMFGIKFYLILFIILFGFGFLLYSIGIISQWQENKAYWKMALLIIVPCLFITAHLLDRFWWQNTETYHRLMKKT